MISPISFYFLGFHRFEDDFTDFVFYLGISPIESDYSLLFFSVVLMRSLRSASPIVQRYRFFGGPGGQCRLLK